MWEYFRAPFLIRLKNVTKVKRFDHTRARKKTGRAQSVTEMETATVAMTVIIAIIRDCDYCVQRPLVQPQSESQKRTDCDCE